MSKRVEVSKFTPVLPLILYKIIFLEVDLANFIKCFLRPV
jgi:hypothetical protein